MTSFLAGPPSAAHCRQTETAPSGVAAVLGRMLQKEQILSRMVVNLAGCEVGSCQSPAATSAPAGLK
jgi:hypothetical protein